MVNPREKVKLNLKSDKENTFVVNFQYFLLINSQNQSPNLGRGEKVLKKRERDQCQGVILWKP